MRRLWFVLALVFLFGAGGRYSKAQIHSVRALGMGGAFVAVADDENTLHYNPAGLSLLTSKHGTFLLNISAVFDQDTYRVHKFLLKNYTQLKKVFDNPSLLTSDFFASMKGIDRRPTYLLISHRLFEVVGRQSGFCLYENNLSQHLFERGNWDPHIQFVTVSNLIATYGYSRNIALDKLNDISFGLTFRYTYRFATAYKLIIHSSQGLEDYYKALSLKDLYQKMNLRSHSLAVDMGYLYCIKPWALQVGLVIRNFMAHTAEKRLRRCYTIGFAFRPTNLLTMQTVREMVFAVDYNDIYRKGPPFTKKLCLGVEVKIPGLRVRLGSRGGKITYGGRLELGALRLDYAYAPLTISPPLWEGIPEYKHYLELRLGK